MAKNYFARACALFMLLLPLLAVPVHAAGPKKAALPTVVLLPVNLHGEKEKEALASYQGAIAESLQSRYKVIAGSKVEEVLKKVTLKESQKENCDMTRCLGAIATEFNAEFVAVVDVTKMEGDYSVSLKILDVVANELELSKTDTCSGCKVIQVVEKLKLLVGGEKAAAGAAAPSAADASGEAASKGAGGNEMELTYWNSIKDSTNPDDFEAYLQDYPKGKFAGLAKSRIASLKKTASRAQESDTKKAADDASGKELAFWNSIKDGANADDFAAYLQAYPAGTFALLAKSRIASLKKSAPQAQAAAPAPAKPAPSVPAGMAAIPAGEFWMGSGDADLDWVRQNWNLTDLTKKLISAEQPRHRVRLNGFFMDKYLVTNRQFEEFVRQTGYKTDAEKGGNGYVFTDKWEDVKGAYWREPNGPGSGYEGGDYPVVQASWNDAAAYCKGVGKRLPTEAEWEYAAKGGHDWRYPWGNEKPGNNQANFADVSSGLGYADKSVNDGYKRLSPVGNYPANDYGLYDMAGNAQEWVADWYDENYYKQSPADDPKGPSSGSTKVLRGGSWSIIALYLRAAYRNSYGPDDRLYNLGFRCSQY